MNEADAWWWLVVAIAIASVAVWVTWRGEDPIVRGAVIGAGIIAGLAMAWEAAKLIWGARGHTTARDWVTDDPDKAEPKPAPREPLEVNEAETFADDEPRVEIPPPPPDDHHDDSPGDDLHDWAVERARRLARERGEDV